jgi:EAL domain-containing protein (putative c-di-GMP-specific phosphodiesterase class I)
VIVRSIIELAKNLGLESVAEGVEDEEVWSLLTAMGCDEAQGFLLGPPVPASEIRRVLSARPVLLQP